MMPKVNLMFAVLVPGGERVCCSALFSCPVHGQAGLPLLGRRPCSSDLAQYAHIMLHFAVWISN